MRSAQRSIHRSRGFTLIELAMVIAIGALLLGFGLSVLTAQLTNARIKATQNQATVIKKALITFVATNNRLPCPAVENLPDTNAAYGVEALNPGTCTGTTDLTGASRGIVPWVSLGIADSAALDGWNRRFTYVVATSQTNLVAWSVQAAGQRTVPGMRGNISVHNITPTGLGLPGVAGQNQINACSTTPGDNTCNNFAVVMIVSYGANGSGAFLPGTGARLLPLPAGANELENTDADTAFTEMSFIDDAGAAGGVFDDMVLWLPPATFTKPLQESGTIPSAQGLLNTRVTRIENALLSFAIADRIGDPDGAPSPFGCSCGIDCNGSATTPANFAGCRTVGHRVPTADKIALSDGIEDPFVLSGNVPWQTLGLTATDALDPWGSPIVYTTFSKVSSTGNSNDGIHSWLGGPDPNAYELSSYGPDAAIGGGDDINPIVRRPTAAMLGIIAGAGVPVD